MRSLQALMILGLTLGLAIVTPCWADVGDSDRPPDTDFPDDFEQITRSGLNPVDKGATRFTGTVLDRHREAVPSIEVKLFIGGLLAERQVTDSVGQYNFERVVDFNRNETVILWFHDPSRRLVPKVFVLAESESAAENHLLSSCFTRVRLEPTIETTIYLFDHDTRARQIGKAECL